MSAELDPAKTRKIIHIDMDAFYASVEQRDRPELRGKPVIVGGDPNSRAVVCASSYEARKFKVYSAMSCAEAKRRCPQAIFIYPRFSAYLEASEIMREVLKTATDKIEPLSLDEAYLDVTENKLGQPSATRVAEYLRAEIKKRTQLTASAGVSYNKFLAKLASDLRKPDGLVVIKPNEVDPILLPLKVEKLWGVGKKTAERLHAENFFTVQDIRNSNPEILRRLLGSMGPFLWDLSNGIDEREVDGESESKSCGTERTFDKDLLSLIHLSDILEELCKEISETLIENQWLAFTFTLKVKYFDFKLVTRSVTFSIPTDTHKIVFSKLNDLLMTKTEAGRAPIRLLGVSASNFIRENDPLQLFFDFMKN